MKCPHCLVTFHDDWTYWSHPVGSDTWEQLYKDCTGVFAFITTLCPACERIICAVEVIRTPRLASSKPFRFIVYPKAAARPVPPEVEPAFTDDFKEACLVIGDSEKASAALSRRCLQKLLIEKAGAKEKANLDSQIQVVIDSGKLPSHLTEAIDAIRNIGNFAAHPIKITQTGEVIDVEPGEAEWLLDTLEGLFDFYFVQPAILERKRDALNKKLEEAGKSKLKDTKPVSHGSTAGGARQKE